MQQGDKGEKKHWVSLLMPFLFLGLKSGNSSIWVESG
jgi:hypothetical protein